MADTLESLLSRIAALEKQVTDNADRLSLLEELDDRVDEHDRDIEAIRRDMRELKREINLMRNDLSRVADSQTSHGLTLEKIYSSQEHMIRLLTASVEVKG